MLWKLLNFTKYHRGKKPFHNDKIPLLKVEYINFELHKIRQNYKSAEFGAKEKFVIILETREVHFIQ